MDGPLFSYGHFLYRIKCLLLCMRTAHVLLWSHFEVLPRNANCSSEDVNHSLNSYYNETSCFLVFCPIWDNQEFDHWLGCKYWFMQKNNLLGMSQLSEEQFFIWKHVYHNVIYLYVGNFLEGNEAPSSQRKQTNKHYLILIMVVPADISYTWVYLGMSWDGILTL